MPQKKAQEMPQKEFPWKKVLAAGGVVAVGLGTVLGINYLRFGAGSGKNSAVTPDFVEKEIDRLIDLLNRTFDKKWVDQGLERLAQALESGLGPIGKALLAILEEVERRDAAKPGPEKKRSAVALFMERHGKASRS